MGSFNDVVVSLLQSSISTDQRDKPHFPRVRAPKDYIDLNLTSLVNIDALGDIGLQVESDFDMNMGYRFPWYNKGRYMITKFSPHIKLGGLTHVVFHLYFIRIHLWVDLIAAQMNFCEFGAMLDVEEYRALCMKVTARQENMRFKLNLQFDFNECRFGLLGILFHRSVFCKWEEYYLNNPILDGGIAIMDQSWILMPEFCIENNYKSIHDQTQDFDPLATYY